MRKCTQNEEGHIVPLSINDLAIFDTDIYAYLGYGHTIPDKYVGSIINRLKDEAISLCSPKFGFKIVEGEILGTKRLRLAEDAIFTPDGIITHNLKGSEHFAIIIASVGKEMDKWITDKRQGNDIMESFVADALGSTIVEAVVAWGVSFIEKKITLEGEGITNSYSPGYCGWNVCEQQLLFSLIPSEFCGVTLTESSLMLPIKSVSGIVGIGGKVKKKSYGCAICQKKDCYKRRINQ